MKNAAISTLVLALVATIGDWVWATYLPRHQMTAGLAHGALLCLVMGIVLALPTRRFTAGAAAGLVVGFAAAGLFYLLSPLLRMAAMLPAWFALWVMLSAAWRALTGSPRSWRETMIRGVLAGVASGAAFYLVSGMWTRWDPQSINYADHFARWAVAFAPGFLALQVPRTAPV